MAILTAVPMIRGRDDCEGASQHQGGDAPDAAEQEELVYPLAAEADVLDKRVPFGPLGDGLDRLRISKSRRQLHLERGWERVHVQVREQLAELGELGSCDA